MVEFTSTLQNFSQPLYGKVLAQIFSIFCSRNTGIGLCSSVARIGGICAPLVALLGVVNPSLPYIIFGALGLAGAFLTLFLEETLDKVLPDTVEQVGLLAREMFQTNLGRSIRPWRARSSGRFENNRGKAVERD